MTLPPDLPPRFADLRSGKLARPESSPPVMLVVVLVAALATLAVVALVYAARWVGWGMWA